MNLRDYKRSGFALHSDFANTVANIIDAAIKASTPSYRYQHIQRRAKSITSLERKIPTRSDLDPEHIEEDIKDLAGCRLVFYTNSDVERFLGSEILRANFEVDYDRTKIHHPVPGLIESQFRSRNIVVRLKPDRASLPEYARFEALRCEVQVQTILNHAWAETAHDIIYHRSSLTGIGAKLLEQIERRLTKIMVDHLLPAGYEFQKVWDDYERVLRGQELVDHNAVAALQTSADNNERRDRLEAIADHLLPNLDSFLTAYPPIRDQIVASIQVARATPSRAIQVPGGEFDGVTHSQYLERVVEILEQYRYVDVGGTFDAACALFLDATSDEERRTVLKLVERLSQYELEAWRAVGPTIQATLMEKLRNLPADKVDPLRPVHLAVLSKVLGAEIEGTSSSYDKLTWSFGSVVSSTGLKEIRTEALASLQALYRSSSTKEEKTQIFEAFSNATRTPQRVKYSDDLLADIVSDTAAMVEFFADMAPDEQFEVLQLIEHNVLWYHRRFRRIGERNVNHEALSVAAQRSETAIASFRKAVDANSEFVTFKTLVGFQSVFPPAWEDDNFDVSGAREYRAGQIDTLVAAIDLQNADEWLARIRRCASADLNDGATFISLRDFLQTLGKVKPDVALRYFEAMDGRLSDFLPSMCMGIAQTGENDVLEEWLVRWVNEEQYLIAVALYLEHVVPARLDLLRSILAVGIRQADVPTVLAAFGSVLSRAGEKVAELEQVILRPALKFFIEHHDARWIDRAWFLRDDKAVLNLVSEPTLDLILSSLVDAPSFDHQLETILRPIARRFPGRVIELLANRLRSPNASDFLGRYEPIPYKMQGLEKALAASPKKVVSVGRELYESEEVRTRHGGVELVKIVYPDFPAQLQAELQALLSSGNEKDREFIAFVLREYDGDSSIYDFCKEFVDVLPEDSALLGEVRIALIESDVVSGAFGFVGLYKDRMAAVEAWRSDPRPKVRAFAAHFVNQLTNSAASEQHRAEHDVAMRKIAFDDLDDDDDSEEPGDGENKE